jgi:hypothetical protein
MAKDGNLLAFADDLIIITESEAEAKNALSSLSSLEEYGLSINCDKTQIMTDREDMKEVT